MTARKKDILLLSAPYPSSHFLILLQADFYNRFESTSLTNDELAEIKQVLGIETYDIEQLIAQAIEVHMQESYIPIDTLKSMINLYYIKGHITEAKKDEFFQCCGA